MVTKKQLPNQVNQVNPLHTSHLFTHLATFSPNHKSTFLGRYPGGVRRTSQINHSCLFCTKRGLSGGFFQKTLPGENIHIQLPYHIWYYFQIVNIVKKLAELFSEKEMGSIFIFGQEFLVQFLVHASKCLQKEYFTRTSGSFPKKSLKFMVTKMTA